MPKKNKEPKKYHVNITKNAEDDFSWIVLSNPKTGTQAALNLMEKIQAKINTLDHFPLKGVYVPELLARNIKDYRQMTEPPWRIIFKVDDDTVNVLAIIESGRNVLDALLKKLLK
jgi:toxin ParE1/3/4